MYEFLAPWGVFIPAISAVFSFYSVRYIRRRRRNRDFVGFQTHESLHGKPSFPEPLVSWVA